MSQSRTLLTAFAIEQSSLADLHPTSRSPGSSGANAESGTAVSNDQEEGSGTRRDASGCIGIMSALSRRPLPYPLGESGPRPLPLLPQRRRRPARWHCQCDTAASGGQGIPPPPPCKCCKCWRQSPEICRREEAPWGETSWLSSRYTSSIVDAVLGISPAYAWRLSR